MWQSWYAAAAGRAPHTALHRGEVPRLVQQRVRVHGVGAVDELELPRGTEVGVRSVLGSWVKPCRTRLGIRECGFANVPEYPPEHWRIP